MNKRSKKYINHAVTFFKKSQKFTAILVIFLMLSTVLSSVVCSQEQTLGSQNDNLQSKETSTKSLLPLLKGKSIKEKLELLKERIKNIIERISQIKNKLSDIIENNRNNSKNIRTSRLSTIRNFQKILRFSQVNSTLAFYTNYSGTEKESALKLLKEVEIDVDNDSRNDISVKISLKLKIEKDLRLSINFLYTITRLPNFPNISAPFEAYAELYFPGLLSPRQRGDRIRFGYASPEGEEVPSVCTVTYTYLPNILSLRKRPEHIAKIDPGSSVGKSKLILLLSYTNAKNGEIVSEVTSRTVYNPAVVSSISIGGEGILGGSTFEFTRKASQKSQIDMYVSFEKNNNKIIGYVKDFPEKVTFSTDFGHEGFIEFDTYGKPPTEIGLTDDLINPVNKVFFTNLPSLARLVWSRELLSEKKANISFYTVGTGITLGAHLEFRNNSTLDLSISSKENLDTTLSIDGQKGYLVLLKNEVIISFSLSTIGENNSFILSFNISKFYDKPFEIFFGKLVNEEINVSLASKSFVVSDFYLLLNTSKVSFGFKASQIVKEQEGSITINLTYLKVEENVTLRVQVDVINGIDIYNLSLYFNGMWSAPRDLIIDGTTSHTFEVFLEVGDFEYFVAKDFSWGYFFFRGNITYETYRQFTANDITGGVTGKISFTTGSDGLNISWCKYNISGKNVTKINITGLSFGLENFHLYYGDLIDFAVPYFHGSFNVKEACKNSGYIQAELESQQSYLDIDFSFNFTKVNNESSTGFNITVDNFHVDHPEQSVFLELAWNDKNISFLRFDAESNVNLSIEKLDIRLSSDGIETFKLENLTGHIIGFAGIHVNLTMPIIVNNSGDYYLNLSDDILSLTLRDVDVYFNIENLSALDLGQIVIDLNVTGTAKFSLLNASIDNYNTSIYGETANFSLINITFGIDAVDSLFDLALFKIENIQFIFFVLGLPLPPTEVMIENITLQGHTDMTVSIDLLEIRTPSKAGFRLENKPNTDIYIDKLSIGLKLSEELIITGFIGNWSMGEGIFDVMFDILLIGSSPTLVGLKIANGSALQSFDMGIDVSSSDTEYAIAVLSVQPPLDYLNFELNMAVDTAEPYILIDTKNTSATVHLYSILTSEFINLGIDFWNENFNITLPHIDEDKGIKIENITLKADDFLIYLNTSNPRISGYLNITGCGDIYQLVNGSWEPLLPGGNGFSLELMPGHAQITFDMAIENYPVSLQATLPTGEEVTIAGTFTVISDHLIIDIYWDFTNGHIEIDMSDGEASQFTIDDFIFQIKNNSETKMLVTFDSLSFVSGSATFIIDNIDKKLVLSLDGSIISWNGFESEFVSVPLQNIGNSTIRFNWESFELLDGNMIIQTIIGPDEYAWNIMTNSYIEFIEWGGINGSIQGIDQPAIHFEAGIGLITWSKSTNNFFSLNISNISEFKTQGEIKIDRYADVDSTLSVEDAYIRYITPNLKIPVGTRLRSFTIEYQRKAHEYLYLEWKSDDYINVTADIAARWNVSFERFFDIMNILSQIDMVSGLVDVNFALHYEPASDNSTYNHLDFNVLDTSTLELLEITNYCLLNPDRILSLGSLQLGPGESSIDWLIDNESESGWMYINNTGVNVEFDGLTLKNGIKELTFFDTSISPGQFYLEANNSENNSYVYINNTATAQLTLLNFSRGIDFLRIEKDTEVGIIEMKPGKFRATWENETTGDYNITSLVNNGIFELTAVRITKKIGNLEFYLSLINTDRNYYNDITIKFRNAGSKNRAIFVDTENYVQFDALVLGVATNRWNLELDLFELRLDFEGWYIGYFDGNFTHGGKITASGIRFINISFSWKDESETEQELFMQYCDEYNGDPQTNSFTLDSTNCTETLPITFNNFEAGSQNNKMLKINGELTINPQKYLIVHFDANPEIQNGEKNGHLFVDTNNQAMGDLSIEARIHIDSLGVDIGLGANLQVLKANDFYIYGAFTQSWWGGWIPSEWTMSGSIDVLSGSVYFIYADHTTEIWPCIPQAVLDKQVYGVSVQHPIIYFDTSQSTGYIFPLSKMRFDWNGDGTWDTGIPGNDHWINYQTTYSHDFSDFLNSGQNSVQIKFQVKTIARQSEITTATVTRGDDMRVLITYDGEILFENEEFTVHVEDYDTYQSISNAIVEYISYDDLGNPTIEDTKTTDASGNVVFVSVDVPSNNGDQQITCNLNVEKDGYLDYDSDYFIVWDSMTDIYGRIADVVTHELLSGVLITAQPGNYNCTTPVNPTSPFHLFVPAGTYIITATKTGYFDKIIAQNLVIPEDMIYYGLGDCYMGSTSYGGLQGTVYDAVTGDTLGNVLVTVIIPDGENLVSETDWVFGRYPDGIPAFVLSPDTYTVNFEKADYTSYSTTVQIVAGQVLVKNVNLQPNWISPNNYNDPTSYWNEETKAYDEYTSSCAVSNRRYLASFVWTDYLELYCQQTNCDKIRFYAWFNETYCNQIDVDVFYNSAWHHVWQGAYNNYQWEEKPISGGPYSVTKARIRFYYRGYIWGGNTADLHEFDFHKL